MKNIKLAALMAAFAILALVACGNTEEEAADTDSVEVSDTFSTDLLVGTLEYLLNEKDEAAEDIIPQQLSSDTADNNEKGAALVDEEEAGNKIEVTIYYGNGASDKLSEDIKLMEEVTAENLINELAGHNIVSLGTKVNLFEEETEDGTKALHLDLDKAFREYLRTMNKESENIIMASLTATFLEAYDAESIMITVDGSVLETNNATYEKPLKALQKYIKKP